MKDFIKPDQTLNDFMVQRGFTLFTNKSGTISIWMTKLESATHGSTQQYLRYFKILTKPETMYYGKPEHKTYHFSNTSAYCVFDHGYPRRCGIDMEIFHPLRKGSEEFEKWYEEVSQEEFLTAVREAIIQTDAWEHSERMKVNGNK